jgi:F420-dependent oxidoreductase-like protein
MTESASGTATARPQVSFGIKTAPQHTTYEAVRRIWREADQEPEFAHAWLFDHFVPLSGDLDGPCLEGWTLLSALAAETSRLRIGIMVTGNTYRHPAILANMGATVDIISGGRMDFGIGAGWNELEHDSYGIPLYPAAERIHRLAESCEIIRLLWMEPRVDFAGSYYHLRDARCEPKPLQKPHPPFVIGGSGERLTLRVVAQYASIWNFSGGSAQEFTRLSGILNDHCVAVGRDPATIQRSVQVRVDPAQLEVTRDQLREFIAAGSTHLVLGLGGPGLPPAGGDPYPVDIVRRLANEVIAPLREEFGLH